MELYERVRRACHVEGMSVREAARVFGLHRDTVRKMLVFSLPPGYRRSAPAARPKLDPYIGVIDQILEDDRAGPGSSAIRPSGSWNGFATSRPSPAVTR